MTLVEKLKCCHSTVKMRSRSDDISQTDKYSTRSNYRPNIASLVMTEMDFNVNTCYKFSNIFTKLLAHKNDE